MLNKIDHIGMAVYNLDESIAKYENLFHIKVKYIETLNELFTRIAFIPVGEVMLELLAPTAKAKGTIVEFLQKHGEGLHHIAYRVDDLESVLDSMEKDGTKLLHKEPQPGGGGSLIAFLDPEETNGVLTELVERDKEL